MNKQQKRHTLYLTNFAESKDLTERRDITYSWIGRPILLDGNSPQIDL